jgi:N-acetylglucosaminyldiphosphoundecaprenol N-acetyl-beta-D-mannosaminyltransferase
MDYGASAATSGNSLNAPPLRADILGVAVSVVDMEATLQTIRAWIRDGRREYICLTNAYGIAESRTNTALREAYRQAGMVVADGVPVVWAAHAFGYSKVGRVYGPDLLLETCARSLETGWSHYFYGGAPGVVNRLIENLTSKFPGLRIAGWASPPFRKLATAEMETAIRDMNQAQADILWIGLGAPRQEIWMAEHRRTITTPVILGVGAAFDFLSGTKPEAPRWMQQCGLGWLFRLITEPRRLWRRYIIGNMKYTILFFQQFSARLWRSIKR